MGCERLIFASMKLAIAYRFLQYSESTMQVCAQNRLDFGCTCVALLVFVFITYVHTNMREYVHTDLDTLHLCMLTHIFYVLHGSESQSTC